MKLAQLEKKVNTIGKALGKDLGIGCLRRRYRVEDRSRGESGLFSPAYLPIQDLWNRLDYVETALRIMQQKQDERPSDQ